MRYTFICSNCKSKIQFNEIDLWRHDLKLEKQQDEVIYLKDSECTYCKCVFGKTHQKYILEKMEENPENLKRDIIIRLSHLSWRLRGMESHLSFDVFKKSDLLEFKDEIDKDLMNLIPSGLNSLLQSLNAFIEYLKRGEIIVKDPVRFLSQLNLIKKIKKSPLKSEN